MIYHIVAEPDLRAQFDGRVHSPSGLDVDGFVHHAFEPSVVPVANDYYAGAAGRVLVLEIDPARLTSETRNEAAAPTAGGATSHLASASKFPHVYGPINKEAITAVGVLGRTLVAEPLSAPRLVPGCRSGGSPTTNLLKPWRPARIDGPRPTPGSSTLEDTKTCG